MKPLFLGAGVIVVAVVATGAQYGVAAERHAGPSQSPAKAVAANEPASAVGERERRAIERATEPPRHDYIRRCPSWWFDPVIDDEDDRHHHHLYPDVFDECDPPKPVPKPTATAAPIAPAAAEKDRESHNQGESRHGW